MLLNKFGHFKHYKTETTSCKIKLSSNENPFSLSQELREKICQAVEKIEFQRYPDPESLELKEIIADLYKVDNKNLVLSNGSDELIQILTTITSDADQGVMFPYPTFPMYQVSADVCQRKKIELKLDDNFDLTKDSIEKSLEKKPGIVFFARPNNPTGNSFNRDLIMSLVEKNIFTVVDEAYIDFSEKKAFIDEALKRDNLVVMRTMSKIGLAGIRLGVLIAKQEIAQTIDKLRAPFNITYPTQVIAKIVLTHGRKEIINQLSIIKSQRDFLINELKKIKNVKVFPSDANFFLIKVNDGDKTHQALINRGILVRNMTKYADLKNCLRITVGKPEENQIFINELSLILK